MLVFGHEAISSPPFIHFSKLSSKKIDEKSAQAKAIYFFNAKEDKGYRIAKRLAALKLSFSVQVYTLIDVVVYNSLGASYLIVGVEELEGFHLPALDFYFPPVAGTDDSLRAKLRELQKTIDNYFMDAKLLLLLESTKDQVELMSDAIIAGIDGVIFDKALIF